jgi:plasmid stability protein
MIACCYWRLLIAQILVRALDQEVVERLKRRAREEGCSLQSVVKHFLEQAAFEPEMDMKTAKEMVENIRQKFKGRRFPDSVDLIRQDRDR